MIFSWDDWNVDHIAKHGVFAEEAEFVVKHAIPPFPSEAGDGKWVVWGATANGRQLQVVFVYRSEGEIDFNTLSLEDLASLEAGDGPVIYIVHAMELTRRMKSQLRRRKR